MYVYAKNLMQFAPMDIIFEITFYILYSEGVNSSSFVNICET